MNAITLHLSDMSKTLAFVRTDVHFYGSHTDHGFDMFCSIHARYAYHNAPGLAQPLCPMNAITLHLSDRSETPAFVRTDVHFYVLYTQVTYMWD